MTRLVKIVTNGEIETLLDGDSLRREREIIVIFSKQIETNSVQIICIKKFQ